VVLLAILLFSVLGSRARVAFFCGFLHGLIFVLTCVSWVAEVLSVHGGMSAAAGWAVLFLIATVWGCSIGLFTWMVQRLSQKGIGLALSGAPFLWISTEVFRAYLPQISFPWGLLGYPAAGNPALVQLATITGIYGVSFLVAVFNFAANLDSGQPVRKKEKQAGHCRRRSCDSACGADCRTALRPYGRSQPRRACRSAEFPENMQYVGDWYADHKA